MAKSFAYDHPTYTVVRQESGGEAGGAATTEYAKVLLFTNAKLKAAYAYVTTAGTDSAHGFDVYVGTTSVGSLTLGTNAAGYTASVELNQDVTGPETVSVQSLSDATGKAMIAYEYVLKPGANVT